MRKEILISVMLLFTVISCACSKDSDDTTTTETQTNVYYVSTTGNNSNTGTINTPLKSISAALDKAVAGDTVIVRGGHYYELLEFSKSGTKNKLIIVKAYPGETPVIDGSKQTVSGWMALVTMKDIRYISLEGFDICNLSGSAPDIDPEGISITGASRDITIKDCNIYNIKNNYPTFGNDGWRSAHAIFVLGNGASAISNLTITGCTVHDTQTGTSESVTLAGNIDGFTFSHNKIYDIENIGVIIAGGDNLNPSADLATNYARNGVVADNELYNNSHTRSPEVWGETSYGAIAIYVCGGANTIIERNKVYNCDRGIGLVSESNKLATKDCIVRNNFVYNCWRTGIYMGDYLNYTSGGTTGCSIVNNTLMYNDAVVGAFGEIEGEIRLTENCTNNVIKNNIIYARANDVFIHKYSSTGSNNVIDYNLYYTNGTPRWIWGSVNDAGSSTLDDWTTISDSDENSTSGLDPQFVSTSHPDLHILASSPAKNSGIVISSNVNGTTDIDGKARIVNNQISKGAQQ